MLPNAFQPYFRRILCALAALFLLAAPACKRNSVVSTHEYMYVSAVETALRDRVATMYNKSGTVHNGERVEVLERAKRFVRVRTDKGLEGWVEQRSLISQDVYDGFQKLAQDSAKESVQGHGTTRAELNMHLTPARDGEHLYQLKEGEKVEILQRATSDRNAPKAAKATAPAKTPAKSKDSKPPQPAPKTEKSEKPEKSNPPAATPPAPPPDALTKNPVATATVAGNQPEPPKQVFEDWYLVRNSAGQVGWVLMRMVDLDVPLDIAQYAEGQRIVGYFVLNKVTETIDDQPKEMPQYLVLLNQPKDGLPYDFNQVRVFTRNRNKHRYETAYRERDFEGFLPASVSHANFDKEGDLPTFTIRKKNAEGQIVDVTYKMNGPIVRRVPTAEELAAQKAKHDADLAARQQAKAQAKSQPKSQKSATTKKAPAKKKKHH